MAKIIYLEDRINGLHCYTPEMGQRKPDVKLEARLSHYGNYYIVDTPLELNGRALQSRKSVVAGCKQQIENWLSYRVTEKAFESCKRNTQYQWNVCLIKHYTGGTAAAQKEKVK